MAIDDMTTVTVRVPVHLRPEFRALLDDWAKALARVPGQLGNRVVDEPIEAEYLRNQETATYTASTGFVERLAWRHFPIKRVNV